MKKSLAFMAILLALISVLASGCGAILEDAAKLTEYEVDGDVVPSIGAVVGEREVTGVKTETSNGAPSKQYTYASETVFDDLLTYISALREEDGWLVTEDFDLNVIPGTAQLGKASKDDGQILILSVAYEETAYAIKITKAEGTIE